MNFNLSDSSAHGTLQARILEPVAISYSRRSLNPGIKPAFLVSPALAGRLWFFLGGDAREFPGGLLKLDPAFAYAEPPSS